MRKNPMRPRVRQKPETCPAAPKRNKDGLLPLNPAELSSVAVSGHNAEEARTQGGELELTARPIDGLRLTTNVGYVDFVYRDYRGAGCTYNDIVDRDLDRQVERTRLRPLARGRVSLWGAWALLVAMSLIGLAVLLQLERTAQFVALASLAPVAAYPFMKRITWWPQAWLGLVFSWAALVGWPAVTGEIAAPMLWLYAGSVFWVIGYDTIYALQDKEDDALIGVKSSARALGRHARLGIAICYLAALFLWLLAFRSVRIEWYAPLALLPVAAHLIWQVATLKADDGADALAKFRANRFTGFVMFLACYVVGTA